MPNVKRETPEKTDRRVRNALRPRQTVLKNAALRVP